MKKYQCTMCGYLFAEAQGFPALGISPGTLWENVPEDFVCPECGAGKAMFELVK